jgi:hypothetical protein
LLGYNISCLFVGYKYYIPTINWRYYIPKMRSITSLYTDIKHNTWK